MKTKEVEQYLKGIWDASHKNPSDEEVGDSLLCIPRLAKNKIVKEIVSRRQAKGWDDLLRKIEFYVKDQLKEQGAKEELLKKIVFVFQGHDFLTKTPMAYFEVEEDLLSDNKEIIEVLELSTKADKIWESSGETLDSF